MSKIKIFVKELEHIDVLEVFINKFIDQENIEVIDIKTNIAKDKYGGDLLIVSVIYEDLELDEEECEEEDNSEEEV